jgi:hypothetical protein
MMPRPAQRDLFDFVPPPAPRKRPAYRETSREAYRAHQPISGAVDQEIVAAVRAAMPTGLTDQGIEDATGRPHQTISANRRHLVKRGVLKDSGFKAKLRSGREAILWILA